MDVTSRILSESESIMAWLDRRLEYATSATEVNINVKRFLSIWSDFFGTTDNIPQWYKDKVEARYHELKVVKPNGMDRGHRQ